MTLTSHPALAEAPQTVSEECAACVDVPNGKRALELIVNRIPVSESVHEQLYLVECQILFTALLGPPYGQDFDYDPSSFTHSKNKVSRSLPPSFTGFPLSIFMKDTEHPIHLKFGKHSCHVVLVKALQVRNYAPYAVLLRQISQRFD